MSAPVQEVAVALRWLRRRPGLATTSIVSLALGIGANVAVFRLVDALVFRPLPIHRAAELVRIRAERERERTDVSAPVYRDLRGMQRVLRGLLASAPFTFSIRAGETTERVHGELVSSRYFEVLGVALEKGRDFLPGEEDSPSPVVVISDRLFHSRFASDPAILGRVLRVNGYALTIVGVAPPEFHGFVIAPESDLWAPISLVPSLWPSVVAFFERRDQPGPVVLGRLKADVSVAQVDAALGTYERAIEDLHPDTKPGTTLRAEPFSETRLSGRGPVTAYLGIVVGISGMVFAIACLNVAGLRLSDLAARGGELAIRQALGASRLAMARQFLWENGVLYAPAFVASLAVAWGGIRLLRRLSLFRIVLREIDFGIDGRVLVAAFAISLAGAALGSLVMVAASHRFSLVGRSGPLARRNRLANALLVVQVALSSVLLVGAGLLARTLRDLYAIDPGFRTDDVLFCSVDLQSLELRYDETRARAFYREVLDRVEAMPGVRSAAWSADTPFERFTIRTLFVSEDKASLDASGDPEWIATDADIVSPAFLRTMGIDLVRGRDFTGDDDDDAPGVVLVNETFARTIWPGSDAVGKRVRVFSRRGVRHDWYEVVGVVRDVKVRTLWEEPRTYLYFPLAQRYFQNMNLHVRTLGPPTSALPAVREAIRSIDPDLPVFDAHPLGDERDILLARQRSVGVLLGLAAALALAVSAVGTFGATAERVRSRVAEIGIRVALGARAGNIVSWVLRSGLAPVGIGVAAGIAVAVPLARTLGSVLVRVSPADPVSFTIGAALSLVAALVACWIPARRASRIDPAVALRAE